MTLHRHELRRRLADVFFLLLHLSCLIPLSRGDASRIGRQLFPLEGASLRLSCPLKSASPDSVSWTRDDGSLSASSVAGALLDGSVLSLVAVTRHDSGFYRCRTANSTGVTVSAPFHVIVSYAEPAPRDSQSEDVKVARNRFTILQPPRPKIHGQISNIKWTWYYEEKLVVSDEVYYVTINGELVIVETNARYGNYRCELTIANNITFTKRIILSEGDTFHFPHEAQFAIVRLPTNAQLVLYANNDNDDEDRDRQNDGRNESAVFECVPTNWIGQETDFIDIEWFINGAELDSDLASKFHGGIEISHANRRLTLFPTAADAILAQAKAHAATVRCAAATRDGLFRDQAQARLDILEFPRLKPDSIVSVELGESTTLSCEIVAAWPRPRITWLFNGLKLVNQTSNTLNLRDIRLENFGVYQCEASNIAGIAIANFRLVDAKEIVVHEKVDVFAGEFTTTFLPVTTQSDDNDDDDEIVGSKMIDYGPSNQSILIGSNIQMPCKLSKKFAGRDDVTMRWFRNGREIVGAGDMLHRISINREGSLLINQVGPDNIGMYTCEVRTVDAKRREAVTAWLRIIEKPGMPQNVVAELKPDVMPIKVHVTWDAGFDGNSPIIKYVIESQSLGANGLWSEWTPVLDNIPAEACCSASVANVKPSESTVFRVIAVNRYGAGKPSLASRGVRVPQQPPADAPRQVAASARSASSIMVQWQPPPAGQWNGEIKGYIIRYRLSGYATADSDYPATNHSDYPATNEKNVSNEHARNTLIEPLITWREYDIQVAAYNDRGPGVFSKPIVVTTLEGVPMQSPQNVAVEVLNSTAIRVEFDPPDQQMIPGVNLGYKVELWKDDGQANSHGRTPFRVVRLFPESGRQRAEIGSLERFGHYNLTVVCLTAPGEGPRSPPVEVITREDVPGPISSISFDEIGHNSVLVKWEPPADRNGVIQKYIVRYWKLNAENTTQAEDPRVVEVSADETAFLVDGLSASTRYGVDVSAVTRVGNGPRVEANFESGVTPELPGRPTALNASNITARGARLQFSPGFDGHSPIRRWIVEARVGDDTIFLPVFNVSQPKATTIFVDGLRPYTKYQLRLVAENVRGRSAASEPTRPFHTSATFPDTPPDNVFVEPIGAVSARVTWTPLLAGQWNGPPIGYVLMSRRLGARLAENKTNETNWTEILISNPRSGEAVLSTLKPFTLYEVKVCAKNSFGCSQFTDPISTFTYESVPSASPNEIVARAERNSIKVSWRPVDELERNGNILGYLIRWDSNFVPLPPLSQFYKSGHKIWTPTDPIQQNELIGANLNLAQNIRPYTREIRVSVSEVLLNGTNVFEKELEVNGEQNCSVEIEGLMSAVVYRVTVVAFTVIGDGPPGVANRTVTTAENVPDKPSSVSFLYRFINEVRLTWRPPTRPNGRILGYSIRYWLVDGVESDAVITQVPANVEIFSATSLTPNVAYEFAIRAETAVGWGAERHVRVWTTEQSVPLPTPAPPSRNLVRPQLPDAIHLTWSVQADDGGVHFYKRAGQMRKMTRRMNDDDATRSALAEIRLAEVEYRRAENNAEGAERRAHNGSFWTNAMILDLDIFPDADSNDQQQQHRTVTVKGLYPNTAYKFRLRFVGDFAKSIWSYESEWIRTSEAPPGAAPQLIETIPQGSRSLLVKWRGTPRDTWNADIVGYRLLYRIYEPANASDAGAPFDTLDVTAGELLVEAMRARRDKRRVNETNVFQKLLKNLISFRHYIVHVEAVNAMGTSRRARSTPAFAYVGYTLPTVRVDVVEARALSSTSIRVAWTHEKLAGNDETLSDREEGAINGYRIRYAPSRQTIAGHNNNDADDENFGGLLETDVVTTDQCCEFTLTDLRKFTNYTIHIAAYNRAGEGLRSEIEAQTNEDVPGPVGSLVFEDVLLDSVNVSWTPPQRANGRIVGYVVSYRTYRLDAESRREIQQRTELSYWWANDLDENATYFFSVAAETMAGRGIETTANVNIGFNEGAPSPAGRPHISLEHSTFLLRWDAPVSQGAFPIKGHLIQAKQLAMNSLNRVRETRNSGPNRTTLMFGARDQQSENGNSRRLTRRLIAERHPLGEWFTLANVDDDANGGGSGGGEFRVAYRQLEPSARYVFRVFARNRVGVGRPSADSEPLFVPASLPDDPFWNQWWFLVIVALVLLLVVLVFVSLLLWTGRDIRRAAYGAVFGAGGGENAKKDAFDTLQLSDGVAYELHHSSRGAKRGEDLLRPNTHTSWISTMGAENNGAADGATTNAAICASSFSRRVSAISDYQHVAGNNYNLLDKSRTTMESNATSKYESDETYHRTSRANNNNGAAGKIDAVNGCHSFYDALTTDAIPSEFVGGAPSATSAKKKNAAAAATVDEGHYFDAGQPYGLYDHDEATMGVDDPFMGGYSATSINNSNQYDAFIGGYRRVSDHFDKHSDNAGNTTNSFLLEQLPTSARQIASNDGTDGIKGLGPAVGSGGFSSFV